MNVLFHRSPLLSKDQGNAVLRRSALGLLVWVLLAMVSSSSIVNIALDTTSVTACEAGDDNHDGQITVEEILVAVNHALNGCPANGANSE